MLKGESMKIRKYLSLTVAVTVSVLLFGGCGENSSISDADINYTQTDIFNSVPSNVSYSNYTVRVVDDNITGANVKAYECNSSKEIGNGTYVLTGCVNKPSYIVVEGGIIGDTNVTQAFPLILNTAQTDLQDGFVVTPLTTLVADANETEIDDLAAQLGITKNDIYKLPSEVSETNMTQLLEKINAIYLKAETDGAVANKLQFIKTVREKIREENIRVDDINITKLAVDVEKASQENPALFGLVFMDDLKNDDDVLSQIYKEQHPNNVSFLGLVFDKKIPNAKITVYRADNNEVYFTTVADENGRWEFNLTDEQVNEIQNSDFVLILKAVDPEDSKKVLTSSISSQQLRDLIAKSKKLTPSKSPDLIISNVTAAENAILDKRGALYDASSYESNRTDLKTYYPDKILKAAAVIQDIVDNNSTLNGGEDSYTFIKNNIDNSQDVDFSPTIQDVNTADLENNIKQNSMLKQQLDFVPNNNLASDETFESMAQKNGYAFYRLLAYYKPGNDGVLGTDDDVFVREYTKIVTAPGYYATQICTIENNNDENDYPEWQCSDVNVTKTANFSNGDFNAQDNGIVTNYTLDDYVVIPVRELNREYNLYEVSVKTMQGSDILNNEPEVLVDSYDVVELFRLMNSEDPEDYNALRELVKGKSKEEVNAALNRFVREQIENVKKIFEQN
jgi:hypothetical protein